ncbi:gliding motility-associated C-terminal domain-containing protein [Flavivirga abyssicola]|uniref:T9SS type B sorting domain-containing protein n=1 Tax=Flavivirga abyssicola TaxID=3063533 RepID=UPI002ED079F4|nr:gliding motility-associated C-terminal domain-containing protein [Flavivirga sp. MEBiC07777]
MKTLRHFLFKNKHVLFFKSLELKKEQFKYSYLLIFTSLLFSISAISQTNISGVINDYQAVTGISFPGCGPCNTSPACLNAITVGNASAFSIGDKVLIIQMKGATIDNTNTSTAGDIIDIGNAGNYEFFTVSNIIGNDVYPNGPLVNTYDIPGLVQLVRVPNFNNNVNVTGTVSGVPWDPVSGTGGVVAIFVEDTLTLNADIDAGEMGYNGVTVSANGTLDNCSVIPNTQMVFPSTNTVSSPKGQGIVVDDPNFNRGRGPRANGGGGGVAGDSGGGGGSNYGAGGIGGNRWCDTSNPLTAGGEGGISLQTYLEQRRVFLGGAGGAGYITNLNPAIATNGGGIVVIRARHIVGNNRTIFAQGADSTAPGTGIDGGGGGGAGGSVAFDIESYSGTVNVDISGGDGQDLGTDILHGPGGGGGGGVFLHNLEMPPANIIIDFQGGIAGVHQAPEDTNTNGAQDGTEGGIISYYTIVETKDRDGDGVEDFCDLDSDGDGILDTEEAGDSTFDPSGDADGDGIDNYLDSSDTTPGFPSFTDTNGDGVNDLYDNDGDGIPDFLDLDSDNDGIYDVIEAGGVDGDGDGLIGTGALVDTDGDGWSDITDPTNGGIPLILIQSDGDSIPDLLDVDSDGDGCPDALEGSGSFVAGDLTSSNNLADDDEGSVDSDGVPTNTGSPQGTNALVTTASALGGITTQPTASVVCSGNNASFTVVDTGDNLVYQWQERIGAGAWTDLSNAGIYSGTDTATLTLTAPPIGHSGREYRVVITSTTNECKNTLSNEVAITVNALPGTPAITGTNTLCVNDTTTLNTTAVGTIVWSSATPAVATINPGTGEVTAISSGTTDISYTVTDGNSCSSTSGTFTVTVNALPGTPAITGTNTLCVNDTTTLNTTAVGTIVWSSATPAVATINPGTGEVTAISSGTTDISYTVTDGNSCSSTSGTFTVTVNALPGTPAITGTNTLCVNDTTTLNTTAVGTIVWSSATPAVATINPGTGEVTAISSGTTDISYTVTDGNSCSSTSGTFTVTVNALPGTPAITGTNTLCVNDTTTLNTTAVGTIVWSSATPAVATINPGTGEVTAISSGTTDISYTVTDGNSCSSTSGTFTVTVNALPGTPAITGTNTLCVNDTTTLNTTAVGTIVWSSATPAVATINPGTGEVTAISSGTTDISYTVTDGNSCSSTSGTFTVTVNALPGTPAITGTNTLCVNDTTTLNTTAVGTIVWSSATPAVATINPGTGEVTAISSGTTDISYTVTDGNSCSSTSGTFTVTVNALPGTPAITGTNTLCVNDTTTLNTTAVGTIVWSSATPAVATINPGTGEVTAISSGTTDISYTVTDGNSCSSTSGTFTVTVNALPGTPAITGTNTLCVNDTTTLNTTAVGTIVWSSATPAVATINPGTGEVTAISSGTTDISYTVTDGNSCSSTSGTFTVTVNALPGTPAITGTNTLCVNDTTTLNTTAVGTIVWSSATPAVATINPGTGEVTAISSGTTDISYTVTDGNSCSSTSGTFTVTVNALPGTPAITGTNTLCVNDTTTLNTTAVGTIVWSSATPAVATINPGTGEVTAISSGTTDISYTVTDGNSCSSTSGTFTVTVNALPGTPAITGTNTLCVNDTTTLNTTAVGTIVWSSATPAVATINPGTGEVTAISSGTTDISYTVTDGNSCSSTSGTFTVTVNALPGTPAITGTNTLCVNDTTTLNTTAVGTIVWSSATPAVATINPGTGEVTAISSGTTDISYTVTDGNSCSSTSGTFTVTVNALPGTPAITGTNTLCVNDTTTLNTTAVGTIVWSSATPAVATINPGTGEVTAISSGTTDISYTVTDGNSCSSTSGTFTVTVNALPGTPAITGTNTLCVNDTTTLNTTAVGTIVWSSATPAVATINPGTGEVTAISSGTTDISYTVTDGNSCSSTSGTFTVTVNALPGTPAITGTNTLCVNDTTTLNTTAVGTIVWSSATPAVATINPGTGEVTAISSGTTDISYTVTDGNSCSSTSGTFTVTVNALPGTPAITGTNTLCVNDTTTLNTTAVGTIVWSSATPAVATINPGTGEVTAISSGTTDISYTVTDGNSCSSTSGTFTVTVNALPGTPAITGTNTLCVNDTTTLNTTAVGTIVWSSATPAVATINPGTGEVTAISSGTTDISYTVTDGNSCSSTSGTFTVTVNALPGTPAITGTNTLCVNDTTTLNTTAVGTIVWSSATPAVATINPGTGEVTAISSGTTDISYTVTDGNSCSSTSGTFTVTVNALPGTPAITGTNTLCVNDTTTLNTTAVGTIVWSSATPAVATINPGTGEVTAISSGTTDISYTVTDGNSCSSTSGTFTVTVNALPGTPAITGTNTLCVNDTTTLNTTAVGTIVWSSATPAVATINPGTGEVTAISSGTTDISYTVTDGNSCSSTSGTFTVTVNALPGTPAITGTNTLCVNDTTTLNTTAVGTIVWSSATPAVATINPGTGEVTAISSGTTDISYTVTDGNSCSSTSGTFTVTVNALPGTPAITGTNTLCVNDTTTLNTTAVGTIVWSSATPAVATINPGTGEVTAISSGTTDISYTVTDGNSCSSTSGTFTVTVNALPGTPAITGTNTLCVNDTTTLNTTAVGTIVWSSATPAVATINPGTGEVTAISSGTTDISYTVTDGNSCSSTSGTFTVTVNALPGTPAITGTNTLCVNDTTTLNTTAVGTIVWSSATPAVATINPGTGEVTAISSGTTDISYTVTDGNSCSSTSGTFTVTVNALPGTPAITGTNTLCVNDTTTLNTTAVGTIVWSSATPAVATINPGTGEVTAISSGTTDISYTVTDGNSCSSTSGTFTVTVNALPGTPAITGTNTLCVNDTTTLNTTAVGTIVWSSATPAVATINPGTGEVTAISSGTTDISYTVTDGNSCSSTSGTFTVTVNALPGTPAITGTNTLCVNDTTTLNTTAVGTIVWSSATPAVATINPGTGEVTAISSGTTDISYTVTDGNSCSSTSGTFTVTVNALPGTPAITGTNTLCVNDTTTLNTTAVGTIVWSSATPAVATINPGTGEVTAISSGTTDISYTVTDGNSCSSTSGTFTVTVNALPGTPAITGTNTLCVNDTTTLNTTAVGTIVWSSATPAVATINPGTGEVTAISSGTTDISYTVTDGNSCSSTSGTFTVTVNALPGTPAITGTNTLCVNDTTTLNTTAVGTIVWSSATPAVATINPGTGEVTAISSGTTDISYTVTDGNSCSSTSGTFTVTVNALPGTPAITGTNTLCVNDTTTLNTTAVGTIVWSSATPAVATINPGTGEVTAISSGTTDISYTVTDGNSCSSTSGTFTVTVNALPGTPAITGTNTLCVNDTTTLNTTAVGTIVWSSATPAVATINPGTGEVTAISSGTTDISYTVTDGNSCSSTSGTFTVTVNALPGTPAITGTNTLCVNDTTTLNTTAVGTIVWSSATPAVATINPGTGEVTAISSGTTDISYTVTDGNSCSSTSGTFTVTVNALPGTPAITGTNTLCVNDTTTLNTTAVGTIVWSSATPAVATINPGTGEVTAISSGTTDISYTVTDGNSCSSTSGTFTVTVNALPIAPTMASNTPVCSNSDAIFTITGTPNDIVTYNGSVSGNVIIGGTGTVDITINNVTTDVTINLVDIANANCNISLSISETIVISSIDSDGDGVIDCDEVTPLSGGTPTNPNDFCSYNPSDVTQAPSIAWNNADCDGDGVTNGDELTPPDGESATDPNEPCDFITSDITLTPDAAFLAADCDGDGVTNGDELTPPDGESPTDPNVPCDFITSDIALAPDAAFLVADCDGDGVTNGDELTPPDGESATDPNVPCDFITSDISLTPDAAFLAADCDGDGVTNGDELTPPDGESPTDPNDPCDFITSDITSTPDAAFLAADCDGDGVTNGDELTPPDGESATDPNVPCDFITSDISLTPDTAFLAADCDGDGVTNGDELTPPDGESPTDPNVPCDFITSDITLTPDAAFLAADCDGDGVTNGDELTPPDGESATDPNEPCDFITSDITLTPDAAFLAVDCDGDGVTNGDELTPPDGESATDPNEPCDFITSDISLTPDAAFLAADCDGDGVTNGDELTPPDGESPTDPNEPCDFTTSDISLTPDAAFLAADCDGDGVTNGDELTPPDGESPTDPNIPCDFVTSDISLTPDAAFLAADCDGDGVTNGDELTPPDGESPTDPNIPCDFITSDISLAPDAAFLAADCDGDGVTNGDELTPPDGESPTDPHDPCSYRPSDITVAVTTTADCTAELEVTKLADASDIELGDEITYTIEVENTGNVTLTSISLVDTFTDINGNPLTLTEGPVFDDADLGSAEGTLLVGEIATYTATFEITQQAINSGGVRNSVEASGISPSFETVTDVSDDGDDVDGNTEDDPTETELGCLIVINEFSPNGDGVNEFLIINCITNYPNNRLEIYNRWGNIVYKKQGYNNEFDGTSNGRSTINGTEKLPVGTYYYVLDLGDGSKPKVGWLYINR